MQVWPGKNTAHVHLFKELLTLYIGPCTDHDDRISIIESFEKLTDLSDQVLSYQLGSCILVSTYALTSLLCYSTTRDKEAGWRLYL